MNDAELIRQEQLGLARMCVTCGRIADVPRTHVFPECCADGYEPCLFDMTPQEALQHWRQVAHDEGARITALEAENDTLRACIDALTAENERLQP